MMKDHDSRDRKYMEMALDLARTGLGRVSPNPAVGAVVVKEGEVVGSGFHLWERISHAETIALREAGERARGGDIYVTLEPCSHYGRTPPCVEAIIASGVKRVVVAVEDPDPRVSGRGLQRLRDAGIEVDLGLCREEALGVNEAFFFASAHNRPLVFLKLAMSMDGRIATASGESKWITSREAREYVHRLRFLNDAVLIGSGTLKEDNPRLNIRGEIRKPITRIVLDSSGSSLVPGMRILETDAPIVLFHDEEVTPVTITSHSCSVEYFPVRRADRGLKWRDILAELGRRKLRSILVEGGGRVAGNLIREGYADRLIFFYSPMLLGAEGVPGIGQLGLEKLSDSFKYRITGFHAVGKDLCVEAEAVRENLAG